MPKRFACVVFTVITTCAVLPALIGCASAPSTTSTSTDGATLVSQLCSRCHPVERVMSVKKDRAGWTATVGRMRSHGLQVDDRQAQSIVDYLSSRDGGG